ARPQDLRGRVRLGGQTSVTGDPREQFPRPRAGQDPEVDEPGADQELRPVPGRDHDSAWSAAWQQRPHLGGVLRVVEQDQHTPRGELRPEQRGPLLLARRDLAAVDTEIPQEPGWPLGWSPRL